VRFLNEVLAQEVHESPDHLKLGVIAIARLDRLLEDLLNPLYKPKEVSGRRFAAMTAASSLQKQWRARFKEKYLDMEEIRNSAMTTTGRLRDVIFVKAPMEGIVLWAAKTQQCLSEGEMNQFEAG
jgi:hypothetical protein